MPTDTDSVSKVIMMWKNSCLMLARSDGNGWELPGGHLNIGEKFKDAAKREVFEETGVRLGALKTIIKQKDFRLFVTRPKIIKVKLSDEHIDYKWVNFKQLGKLELSNSTKINLKYILNTIKSV